RSSTTYSPLFSRPLKARRLLSGDHAAEDSSPAPIRFEARVASSATVRPRRASRTFRPSGETSGSPKPTPSPNGSTRPAGKTRCSLPPSASIAYNTQSPSRSLRNRILQRDEPSWPHPAVPSASSAARSRSRRTLRLRAGSLEPPPNHHVVVPAPEAVLTRLLAAGNSAACTEWLSSVARADNEPWCHRGMHHMRFRGIHGTPDPRL